MEPWTDGRPGFQTQRFDSGSACEVDGVANFDKRPLFQPLRWTVMGSGFWGLLGFRWFIGFSGLIGISSLPGSAERGVSARNANFDGDSKTSDGPAAATQSASLLPSFSEPKGRNPRRGQALLLVERRAHGCRA